MLVRPRNDYQVFKTCPEIRSHIIRVYLWRTLYWIVSAPCIAVLLVLGLIHRIIGFFCDLIEIVGEAIAGFADWATIPMDRNTWRLIDEAHTVLSIEEIQNRTPKLELRYGRILPKDEGGHE